MTKIVAVDAAVAAVAHMAIVQADVIIAAKYGCGALSMDVKSVFDRKVLTKAGFKVWHL